MGEPIHVSDDAFEKAVISSALPVLVDFWAPWCGPCRMVAPTLDKIAQDYAGRLVVAKVNTDDNAEWAAHYNVKGIPTMLFFSKGQVVHKQLGLMGYAELKQMVDQLLTTAMPMQSGIN